MKDKIRSRLESLYEEGKDIQLRMYFECLPHLFKDQEKRQEKASNLQPVQLSYQPWYSEAKAAVASLLPERLTDFVSYYEPPKTRKRIGADNYVMADYLRGLEASFSNQWDKTAGLPALQQQVSIVGAAVKRLDSVLYDIESQIETNIFQDEMTAAESLLKRGFVRVSGAWAGVLLERHLANVCKSHSIKLRKKNPTLADLNEALKAGSIIDIPQWRKIQHLSDIRNLCAHDKERDPLKDEVEELMQGVRSIHANVS